VLNSCVSSCLRVAAACDSSGLVERARPCRATWHPAARTCLAEQPGTQQFRYALLITEGRSRTEPCLLPTREVECRSTFDEGRACAAPSHFGGKEGIFCGLAVSCNLVFNESLQAYSGVRQAATKRTLSLLRVCHPLCCARSLRQRMACACPSCAQLSNPTLCWPCLAGCIPHHGDMCRPCLAGCISSHGPGSS